MTIEKGLLTATWIWQTTNELVLQKLLCIFFAYIWLNFFSPQDAGGRCSGNRISHLVVHSEDLKPQVSHQPLRLIEWSQRAPFHRNCINVFDQKREVFFFFFLILFKVRLYTHVHMLYMYTCYIWTYTCYIWTAHASSTSYLFEASLIKLSLKMGLWAIVSCWKMYTQRMEICPINLGECRIYYYY